MAFQVNDQTYSGTYAAEFVMLAMYGMDTVDKGLVAMHGDIKKLKTLPRVQYTKPLKPRQAVPVTNNANPFTLDGRQIIPQSVDVYEEYNPRDLEANQLAEALSATILSREVPQSLQSQLIQLTLNRAAEQYENCIWQGSTNYQGNAHVPEDDARYQLQFFNGFLQRFVNDPLINLSSISPAVISTSNIANILDDLIVQCTIKAKALITDKKRFERMKFIMSPATETIYTAYLRRGAGSDVTFKGNPYDSGVVPPWGNFPIESVAGMADNTIIFCRSNEDTTISNLHVGMNAMADWEIKCERTLPANETFFIQAKFKWDVQYSWPQEIFMFTNLTAASFIAS